MKDSLPEPDAARERIGNREMAGGLQKNLENRYSRILQTAGAEWERRFAGRDPSDACVSVRISAWDRALSGISPVGQRGLHTFTSQAA